MMVRQKFLILLMNIVVTGGTQNKQIMIKLMDILKEIIESKKLDATGMEMDLMILPKFKENGKTDLFLILTYNLVQSNQSIILC